MVQQRKRVNSRAKGAAGEREWARFLTDRGFPAHRGQQFHGGSDSPDVVCASLPHIHWEVKRTAGFMLHQKECLEEWIPQARRDARPDQLPIIAHKGNKTVWWLYVLPRGGFPFIMDAACFLSLAQHVTGVSVSQLNNAGVFCNYAAVAAQGSTVDQGHGKTGPGLPPAHGSLLEGSGAAHTGVDS